MHLNPTRFLSATRRGNALMMVLISLAILMMLVAGAIQFTGTNRQAAMAQSRGAELQACAITGRKMLLSRLRTYGISADSLTLDTVIPDSQNTADQTQVRLGHLDFDGGSPPQVVVELTAGSMGASGRQVRDVANIIGDTTMGGRYWRVVVSCKNPVTNAQSEVEFTFRHGL